MFGWLIYFLVVLVASLAVGRHLGRFRESCTEMTGMMAGMTIGMLGGFALGYGMTAAAGRDLFIGNLIGVLLGAALGGWFGRPGGLMGIMDGSMGGVMGGAMGAMIAAMVFPDWALNWTGVLFGGIYVVGCAALVALIESRAPEHEAIHWLLPKLAVVRREPRRIHVSGKGGKSKKASTAVASSRPPMATAAISAASATSPRTATARVATAAVATTATRVQASAVAPPMQDYYALFGVPADAPQGRIEDAYLDLLAGGDAETARRADRALATLSDPERRAMYDAALNQSLKRQPKTLAVEGRGDCCPPPKKKAAPEPGGAISATATPAVRAVAVAQAAPPASMSSKSPNAGQPALTKPPATLPAQVNSQAHATSAPRIPTPPPAPTQPRDRDHTRATSSGLQGSSVESREWKNGRSTASGGGQGGHGSQGDTQRQAHQAGAGAGKRSGPATSGQAPRSVRDGRYDRPRQGGRANAYQQPGMSFGRRFAIGITATMAAAFVLMLIVYIGTLNSGSSAQASGYLNQSPAGAVYHVPNAVPSQAQLESQAVAATIGADGVQTADLVLDQATSSYKPAAIKVKKGSPVRLNVTVEGSSRDCRSVVRLPALGAQALTQPGEVVPMNFTPSQAGVYEFNCPMQMMNSSYLVVTN